MRKGEVHCRQLFTKAIKGNLTAAKLIAKTAAKYFGVEEANGPSETTFLVVSNKMFEPKTEGGANACVRETRKAGSKKRPSARPKVIGTRQQVPIGLQFRKVAGESITIEIDGTPYRISRWNAYVRQIYNMALNKNNSAARLLDQLRSQFPGDLLPGDPITFIISEDDARL
jgi:hypothetical protein